MPAGAICKGTFAFSIRISSDFLHFLSKFCHGLKYAASQIVRLYKVQIKFCELAEDVCLLLFVSVVRNDKLEKFPE